MPKNVKICLMGFGNVSQAFVHLAERKREMLAQIMASNLIVSAIATGSHGSAIDPQGIDTEKAIDLYRSGQPLDSLSSRQSPQGYQRPLSLPARQISCWKTRRSITKTASRPSRTSAPRLENNMHAVSANKGPVAHAWQELTRAGKKPRQAFSVRVHRHGWRAHLFSSA